MALDTEVEDGKTLARIDDLEPWDDNPRDADEQELERLRNQIENLGMYKPLIVDQNTGVILGGNMRHSVLSDLGEETVWVSLVDAEDESTRLEYALSDNDRAGSYDEDQMAKLVSRAPDIDITDYKVDFYAPTDITQDLAQAMSPEDVVDLVEGRADAEGDTDAEGEDAPADDAESEAEPTPREVEGLGTTSSTAMVQLFMAKDEKEGQLLPAVKTLKSEWGLDNTSDVVLKAVTVCADRAADEEDGAGLVEADD